MTLKNVNLGTGEHKSAAFTAVQPFGQIPVLEQGDFTMFESRAIARYIDSSAGGKLGLKSDPKKAALVETWISAEVSHFNDAAQGIVAERVFKAFRGGVSDETVVAVKLKQLSTVLDIYEKELSKRAFLVGAEASLADLFHLPYGQLAFQQPEAKKVLEEHPNVLKWWNSLTSRPSWVKIQQQVGAAYAAMQQK